MKTLPSKYSTFKSIPGTLIPRAKKARKTVSKEPESVLQATCEAYLDALGLFYIRLPDSLMRVVFSSPAIPIWTKREVADCLAGLPDLTILKDGRFIAIELKTATGKMSQKQRDVQREIKTLLIRDFETFKTEVDKLNSPSGHPRNREE